MTTASMEYMHNFQDRSIDAGHTCVLVGMEHSPWAIGPRRSPIA